MPVFLNAFPLKIPEIELKACQVPYEKEILEGLRPQYGTMHSFRRQSNNILIFSGNGIFHLSGTPQTIALKDNFGIFCSLVKDDLTKNLAALGRWQQIAFHVRQKGIQMTNVDKAPLEGAELPSNTETAQILRPFGKEIPPSGRI